jgi:hypothetical protein
MAMSQMVHNDEYVERQYMHWIGRVIVLLVALFAIVNFMVKIYPQNDSIAFQFCQDDLIGCIVVSLITVWMWCLRLDTVINSDGIYYRIRFFHFKFHCIPWSEVKEIETTQLLAWEKLRGWGLHLDTFRPRYKEYIAHGVKVIKIDLKSHKQIVIGTRHPDEVDRYIAKFAQKQERN